MSSLPYSKLFVDPWTESGKTLITKRGTIRWTWNVVHASFTTLNHFGYSTSDFPSIKAYAKGKAILSSTPRITWVNLARITNNWKKHFSWYCHQPEKIWSQAHEWPAPNLFFKLNNSKKFIWALFNILCTWYWYAFAQYHSLNREKESIIMLIPKILQRHYLKVFQMPFE